MSVKIKKKTITERRDVKFYKFSCDICGRETVDSSAGNVGNWKLTPEEIRLGKDQQDFGTITLEYKDGNYDDGDFCGDFYEFDICPKCFEEKLKPFILSFGNSCGPRNHPWHED